MTGGKYISEETRIGLLHAALAAYQARDFAKRDEICEFLAANSRFGFVDSMNQMFAIQEQEVESETPAESGTTERKEVQTMDANSKSSYEKVNSFANDILEQCQSKGLTISEVNLLPNALKLKIGEAVYSQTSEFGFKCPEFK